MQEETKETYYGKPTNGLILIRRTTTDVRAKIGGIHVPESAQQKPSIGIVLAIGDERVTEFGTKMPKVAQVGDRVLFGKFAGIDVDIDGNEFMIMKEGEILMILPPKIEGEEILELPEERSSLIIQ